METKNLLQDIKPEDRFKALQEMATGTNSEKVRRHYDEDEKAQHKEFITTEGIKLMDSKKEFADISKEFRSTIKTYEEQIKDALTSVKRGYSENEETVFLIDDQDAGLMNVYDAKGVFLYARKLHADERQSRIVEMKTGTHD